MAELVHGRIDSERMMREAARPDCGAIAVFLGITRDHHQGLKVSRLSYEGYETMATASMNWLEREALARFEVASCRIVHRLGLVPLGDASVAIVVAAAHREPAFDACRWAIGELKRTVPIWKKEFYVEGGEGWVEGTRLS